MTRVYAKAFLLVCATAALASQPAYAEKRESFAIVIGANAAPPRLPALSFADDDALRIHRLLGQATTPKHIWLLTDEKPSSHPKHWAEPTQAAVEQAFNDLGDAIEALRDSEPDTQVDLYFYYSGHGRDGALTLSRPGEPESGVRFEGERLKYLLDRVDADQKHIFVDACEAEGVFLSRGNPEFGPDFSANIEAYQRALAPNTADMGILTAATRAGRAGEGEAIRGGYFTHALASGLYGAADTNEDGSINYGELMAFISYYTRSLQQQSKPWFISPGGNDSIVVFRPGGSEAGLVFPAGIGGHFVVLDADESNIIAEFNKPPFTRVRIALPPDTYSVVLNEYGRRGRAGLVRVAEGESTRFSDNYFQRTINYTTSRGPGEGFAESFKQYDPEVSPFRVGFDLAVVETFHMGREVAAASRNTPGAENGESGNNFEIQLGGGSQKGILRAPAPVGFLSVTGLYQTGPAVFGLSLSSSQASYVYNKVDETEDSFSVTAQARYRLGEHQRVQLDTGVEAGWFSLAIDREGHKRQEDPSGIKASVFLAPRALLTDWLSFEVRGGGAVYEVSVDADEDYRYIWFAGAFMGLRF